MIEKRDPLAISEIEPPVQCGRDALMALEPNETNPPVTRSQSRQSAQQVGGSRSIVDQQQLPIFINLRKHRVHGLAQPRRRAAGDDVDDNDRVYADAKGLEQLQAAAIDKLKKFEFTLRRKAESGNDSLSLSGSDQVPDGFRQAIEEYYRSLARKQAQPQR